MRYSEFKYVIYLLLYFYHLLSSFPSLPFVFVVPTVLFLSWVPITVNTESLNSMEAMNRFPAGNLKKKVIHFVILPFYSTCFSIKVLIVFYLLIFFAVLRHKATCDPAGFSAYLQRNGISPTVVERYVGNKWNLLFRMSATVVKHRSHFEEYLEKYCKKAVQRYFFKVNF